MSVTPAYGRFMTSTEKLSIKGLGDFDFSQQHFAEARLHRDLEELMNARSAQIAVEKERLASGSR